MAAADIGKAVARFLSVFAFLAVLVAVVGAAGCGQRFDGPGNAPEAADLAADALAALAAKGSAHFVADLKASSGSRDVPQLSVHLDGDASATALDAHGSVGFGGALLRGRVLVGEHDFFLQFMDQWYGEDEGLLDALAEAKKEHEGRIFEELATPDGLRRNFAELFEGEVKEGPALDGVATWQFEGRLDADGVTDFARRYGAHPTDLEEDMLVKMADASRFVLVVGQEDQLPRRLEFSVELSAAELEEMQQSDPFGDAGNFKATLELSEFGKLVQIRPPASFKPLDALFEQFFSGFE